MKELIWLDDEPGVYSHEQAMKLENEEKRLPTIGELRMAWEQGLKFKRARYWSSSIDLDYTSDAYYFFGDSGRIGFGYIYGYGDFGLVRCVRR